MVLGTNGCGSAFTSKYIFASSRSGPASCRSPPAPSPALSSSRSPSLDAKYQKHDAEPELGHRADCAQGISIAEQVLDERGHLSAFKVARWMTSPSPAPATKLSIDNYYKVGDNDVLHY